MNKETTVPSAGDMGEMQVMWASPNLKIKLLKMCDNLKKLNKNNIVS
jgi:hypothetical protein